MSKILLIEDDLSLSRILSKALESEGYEVILASEGRSGLNKAADEPDLILLDLMLPDISGIDILKKLKSAKKTEDIPVIILTNLADQGTISKILRAGGKDYFIKSDWPIEDLVKKIKSKI